MENQRKMTTILHEPAIMRKVFLFLFRQFLPLMLCSYCAQSFAQFAIIHDKDSLVNVRDDGKASGQIIDKLPSGHLIYCFENKGNWTNIDYTHYGQEKHGYVYHDRYISLSNFTPIKVIKETSNKVVLRKDSLEVTITQSAFDQKKHQFQYVKAYPSQIERIDGKPYWGLDGGMPTRQFESIVVKQGKQVVTLPRKALAGLYQPSIYNAEVYADIKNNCIYIQTMNSDGAGAYFVVWKVEHGVYKDRLIVYGF